MSQEQICYGKKIINFELSMEKRNSLAIEVLPSSDVVIKAPENKDKSEILKKVHNKARWIIKQTGYFKENSFKPEEMHFISGETHLYLGKQYRLKIIPSDDNFIKLKNGYFIINCTDRDNIEALLNNWYKEKAELNYTIQLDKCFEKFRNFEIIKPKLKIRTMKKRWGSYSKKNNVVTLNINLIKTSKSCIDYVITHELCHCIYYSHNKQYYKLISQLMPEWKEYQMRLNQYKL